MEFFLALPFLLFIMILSMNYCKSYLVQFRTMVAARYLAWGNLENQPQPSDAQISTLFFGGAAVHTSATRLGPGSDQQNMANEVSTAPGLAGSQWVGAISSALSKISNTQSFTVQFHYQPLFAAGNYFGNGNYNWYPDLEISGTVISDSQDWRYPDVSIGQIVGDILGGLGKLIQSI
jgi:hypothetical protein